MKLLFLLFPLFYSLESLALPSSYHSHYDRSQTVFRSEDGRSFRVGDLLDYGSHSDVYDLKETSPGRESQSLVLKVLADSDDKESLKEILLNHKHAENFVRKHRNLFLSYDFLELAKGDGLPMAVVMPKITNLLASDLQKPKPETERLILANKLTHFYIRAYEALLSHNYSHGDIGKINVAVMEDGSFRLFDFDTLQRIGSRSYIYDATDMAPEVLSKSRSSSVSDIYTISMNIAQTLIPNYKHISLFHLDRSLANFRKAAITQNPYLDKKAFDKDLKALELLIKAGLNENIHDRKLAVIHALESMRNQGFFRDATVDFAAQSIEQQLQDKLANKGILSRTVNACRRLFAK